MNNKLEEEVLQTIFKNEIRNKELLLTKLDFDLTQFLDKASTLKASKIAPVVHSIKEIINTISSTFS